jgi:protein phosphatase
VPAAPEDLPENVPYAIPSDPIDPEQARYAPRPPRRFAWLRRLLGLLVLVGLVWIAAAVAWSWSQQQYYVSDRDGAVVIFRGLDADLPGLSLSTPYETTDVSLDRLSDFDADSVREGIDTGSLDAAHRAVDNLAAKQTTDPSSAAVG